MGLAERMAYLGQNVILILQLQCERCNLQKNRYADVRAQQAQSRMKKRVPVCNTLP